MKFLKLSAVFVSTILAGNTFADDSLQVSLLKDRRASLTFPEYTTEQKKIVLNQARLTLNEIFVHKELKIKDFGPDADPIPHLNEIEKRINTITDYDFHKRMSELFSKLKDFHTSYSMPAPYSCNASVIPLGLKEIVDSNGTKSIVVSRISSREEYLKLMPKNFQVKKGDQVISYNGIPVKQAMKNLEGDSSGANPGAMERHTAMMLTYVSQNQNVPPTADEVNFVFKNSAGIAYSITLPWLSVAQTKCLEGEKENIVSGRSETAANIDQIEFNKIFRRNFDDKSASDGDGLLKTLEPILQYKKIVNENGTFGYFKLESFMPEVVSPEGVVLEFKKLLQTEFLNTTGIIIDLRDNGGGMIEIADKLTQLFTSNDVSPMNFRLKTSPANLFYLTTLDPQGLNPFTNSIIEANNSGSMYTKPLPLRDQAGVNSLGQYFFRPIAILTNSSCYSSCDMFSAQMQDHGAAVIYGENESTGAGGANNYNLNDMFKNLPKLNKGPFQLLPGNQDIGFSWRQSIRVGLRKGQLLEDVGVLSDKVLVPTITDVTNFSEHQFKVITSQLKKSADNFKSWVVLSNDGIMDVTSGARPDIFAKWANTNTIEFKSNGKILGRVEIEEDNVAGRLIAVPDSLITSGYMSASYEMTGYWNEKKIWRKIVSYRSVPASTLVPISGLNIELDNGLPEYFKVYNKNTKAVDGWNVQNGILKIGSTDKYASEVQTEAALFLKIPQNKYFLKLNAAIDTEENYDFFDILVRVNNQEKILQSLVSGKIELKEYSYDLSEFAGKNIEIVFRFNSDGADNAPGVMLQNISIK